MQLHANTILKVKTNSLTVLFVTLVTMIKSLFFSSPSHPVPLCEMARGKSLFCALIWACWVCTGSSSADTGTPQPDPLSLLSAPNTEQQLPDDQAMLNENNCLHTSSQQVLKASNAEIIEVSITFSPLIELIKLWDSLQSFGISPENDGMISAETIQNMMLFGVPLSTSEVETELSNSLAANTYLIIDYYYQLLPGDSSFCGQFLKDSISFGDPCSQYLKNYTSANNINMPELKNAKGLSILAERQQRQTLIALSETDSGVDRKYIGKMSRPSQMLFKLQSNIQQIIKGFISKLSFFQVWFSADKTENNQECNKVLLFLLKATNVDNMSRFCQKLSPSPRSGRSILSLFSDNDDLLDRVRQLSNHNLESSSILSENQQMIAKAMDSEDKVLKTFMSQNLQETSAVHELLNRFIASNAYSKFHTRLSTERTSLVNILSNQAAMAQALINKQEQEIQHLLQLATHGTPSCQLDQDEVTCSESNVHFTGINGKEIQFKYLSSPFMIQNATFVSCLYRITGS